MSSSHRERIRQALRGEAYDRIPRGEFFISPEFARAFAPVAAGSPLSWQIVQELDLDLAAVPLSAGWGALEQPDEDQALADLGQWHSESDRFVFALIDGPFSSAVKLGGFNSLLHYVQGAPHMARELFRRGAEETRVVAQAVRDAGADGVILGEDIAYNRTTFIGPNELRALYFPELLNAARAVHALGLAAIFHSDGNLNAVLPDLGGCELDGLQGIEPEAGMSMASARAQLGQGLTLWGNLSYEFLGAARTEAEIHQALRQVIAGAQPGPLIFGSCSGLVSGLNPETVRRVYAALSARLFY